MNLVKTEFRKAAFWNGVLQADELYYQGYCADKIQFYKSVRNGEPCGYAVAHIVCRDEDFIWAAAKDIIDRAVKQAAVTVRGIYTFELLIFEAQDELKTFNYDELAQVLVNTSRSLKSGEAALIKYSSVYGIFLKLVEESWGKITYKTSVELAVRKPKLMSAQFIRLLKAIAAKPYPVTVLVNDLSAKPFTDPNNCDEEKIWRDELMLKCAKIPVEHNRRLFLRDRHGLRALG